MNFFYDLLSSYESMTNRKFKLHRIDEGDSHSLWGVDITGNYDQLYQQAAKKLQQYIQQAKQSGEKGVTQSGKAKGVGYHRINMPAYAGNGSQSSRPFYFRDDGTISFDGIVVNADETGQFTSETPNKVTNLIGRLLGPQAMGGEGSAPAGAMEAPPMDPNDPMAGMVDPNMVFGANGDIAGTTILTRDVIAAQDFIEIEGAFRSVWDKIPDKYKFDDVRAATSVEEAKTYVVGGRPQSLEAQLTNGLQLLNIDLADYDEDHVQQEEWSIQPQAEVEPLSVSLIRSVSQRLKKFFKTLAKLNPPEGEKQELVRTATILDSQAVAIHGDTQADGVVFKDRNGLLKSLIHYAEDKFDVRFKSVRTKKILNRKGQKTLRGKMLEQTYCVNALFAQAHLFNKPELKAAAQDYLRQVSFDLQTLVDINKDWAMKVDAGEAAISFEDYPQIQDWLDEARAVESQGVVAVMRQLSKIHTQSLTERQPDLILPTGHTAFIGKSNDVSEVYLSYDKALGVARKLGLPDTAIKARTASELIEDSPVMGKILMNHGLLPPDATVFSMDVSLKHPSTKSTPTVVGNVYLPRAAAFLTGGITKLRRSDKRQEAHYKAFREKINNDLGVVEQSDMSQKATDKLRRHMRFFSMFQSKPKRAIEKSALGNVRVNLAKEQIASLRDSIAKAASYTDKFSDTAVGELYSLVDKLASKDKYEDTDLSKLDALSGRVKFQLDIQKNIDQPETRLMLSRLVMTTAGSVNDQLFEYNNLKFGERYQFEQNQAISGVLKDFIHNYPNSQWKFDISSSTGSTKVTFRNKKNRKALLTFDIFSLSFNDGRTIVKSQLRFSKAAVTHFHKEQLNARTMGLAEEKLHKYFNLQKELFSIFG